MSAEFGGSALARAKINLALHVTGQRADGYHTLSSLVAFADVGDTIRVGEAEKDALSVGGPFAQHVPQLASNLLGDALALVRRWRMDPIPDGVSIYLTKALPISSGIGGGSADAAALIALLTRNRTLTASELADVLELGADVPMCLRGQAAQISGVGELIEAVEVPVLPAVLVNPGIPVSTPSVFKALQQRNNPPLPALSVKANIGAFLDWLRDTRNDLQSAASRVEPEIARVLDALTAARITRMSGSGATCFGLFDTAAEANAAAAEIARHHPDWWVVATTLS